MAQGRPASVPATDDLLRLSARLPAQQKPSTAGAWPLTVRRVFVNLLLAVQDILGGLALVFQRRQVDMTTVDHELTFCSDAAGWMNAELSSRPELAFGQVKIEQSARGSAKRRDLTIYDRSGKIAITGEVKLPYMVDGSSPYNEKVVEDAHTKASRVGAAYFITWNVNRIVLWHEKNRLIHLKARNPSVKEHEILFLDEQIDHLEKAFKSTEVMLDSFRIVLS